MDRYQVAAPAQLRRGGRLRSAPLAWQVSGEHLPTGRLELHHSALLGRTAADVVADASERPYEGVRASRSVLAVHGLGIDGRVRAHEVREAMGPLSPPQESIRANHYCLTDT